MSGEILSDRYQLLDRLGQGGMGVIFRAIDLVLEREVAVKMLPEQRLSGSAERRFRREAQLVAQLDHPGVVPIYDYGNARGALYFVMPLLDGVSLRSAISEASLTLTEAIEIGAQISEALDYSHLQGVIHRDIKPENIWIVGRDRGLLHARLMDFGLAINSTDSGITSTASVLGTLSYFSPEQASTGQQVDNRSDLYSLAAVLYEILLGEPPFTGSLPSLVYKTIHQKPTPPREIDGWIPRRLESLLLSCLEKDPTARPQHGSEVASILRRCQTELDPEDGRRLTESRKVKPQSKPLAGILPLVGNRAMLSELERRFAAATRGERQFVAIGGETGVGKTRVVEELRSRALAKGFRVLVGRFSEQQGADPFQGFCELILDFLGTHSPSDPGLPDLSDLAPELVAFFPVLGEIPVLKGSVRERPATRDRVQLLELLARTLARLISNRPTLIVLEGFHAPDASSDALRYIVHRLGPTPTVLVVTFRQPLPKTSSLALLLEGFADDPRFQKIVIEPLAPGENQELISLLIGSKRLDPELVAKIYQATEGNPLFTVELVKTLTSSRGVAADETGQWSLSGEAAISPSSVPATIQQAVERRLEGLPETLTDLLQLAAVLGRSFEFEELEALAGNQPPKRRAELSQGDQPSSRQASSTDDLVDQLGREGILEESHQTRGDRLGFCSGVVRDVVYSRLTRRRRRSLHHQHARWLEQRHRGRLDRVLANLVHHYSCGDVADRTIELGHRLALRSLDAFRPEDAVWAAKTALDFVDVDDLETEGRLRSCLASAHAASGDNDRALAESRRSSTCFERANLPAEASQSALVAARAAWHGRNVEATRSWIERGLELARSSRSDALVPLLKLATTAANLGADHRSASAFRTEIEELTASVPTSSRPTLPVGGTLVTALPTPVTTLEPGAASTDEDAEVMANIFETLIGIDSDGNLVPRLAESWEGSKDFRLVVRSGAAFSDGTSLGVGHVVATLERLAREGTSTSTELLAAIDGWQDFAVGRTDRIAGIQAANEREVVFHLSQPLPFFAALLTDVNTSIVKPTESGSLIGTGAFRVDRQTTDRLLLSRNPHHWRHSKGGVDHIEFKMSLDSSGIARGLANEEIEVGRALAPRDLDDFLRDTRFNGHFHEALKKSTWFVVFNTFGQATRNPRVRRAIAGAVNVPDIVWRTLGRFAQPATCLIPPTISGHDPGRRWRPLSRARARELLESSGLSMPIRLRATVHPMLTDRYGSLCRALLEQWQSIGVEVDLIPSSMAEYTRLWTETSGVDLLIGRWIPDYPDPDSATAGLFHSGYGALAAYFCSDATDHLFDSARHTFEASKRIALYRKCEDFFAREGVLLPLFNEVDYRIATPRVLGLTLESTLPYADYHHVGVEEPAADSTPVQRRDVGTIRVAIPRPFETLDPMWANFAEQAEVIPNILESLMRVDEGAHVVPLLAESIEISESGRCFAIRLRRDVRFHDGRRLTARDVRYSFERLARAADQRAAWALAPLRGIEKFRSGRSDDIAGLTIQSSSQLMLELERPLSFFPALLTHPTTVIVPEGMTTFTASYRHGLVGTGPFRVVRFDPGQRLELEANPQYWRAKFPRSDRLVFELGLSSKEVADDFRSGKLSLATKLAPREFEQLRADPNLASGFREAPALSTYFVVLNAHSGPFADRETRKAFARALDVPGLVNRTLRRLAIPAAGLLPPGLLGSETEGRKRRPRHDSGRREGLEASAWVNPVYLEQYRPFFDRLRRELNQANSTIRVESRTMEDMMDVVSKARVDLFFNRWVADYPDADAFATLFHSSDGLFGRFVANRHLDRLIEKGRMETDPGHRHAIYREVSQLLDHEAHLITFFHDQVYSFARPEIEGARLRFGSPEVAYEELSIGF